MLTKAEMEDIWNNKPVGYLRNNFCSRSKKNPLRKFFFEKTAKKEVRLDSKVFGPIFAKDSKKALEDFTYKYKNEEMAAWQKKVMNDNPKERVFWVTSLAQEPQN